MIAGLQKEELQIAGDLTFIHLIVSLRPGIGEEKKVAEEISY